MAKAWTFQDPKQLKRLGEKLASWYCGWIDPLGDRRCKSYGPGSEGKKAAFRAKKKIEAELIEGTYQDRSRKTWVAFRAKYEKDILPTLAPTTQSLTLTVLAHFERVCRPKLMNKITTAVIDGYIGERRNEESAKDRKISLFTVNKELRQIRAVLSVAKDWSDLQDLPKFRFLKEPQKMPVYATEDHFTRIYRNCTAATQPAWIPNCTAQAWWEGLLVFIWLTGWRIGQLLELEWSEVDLENSTATTAHEDNKGRRDMLTPLHPLIVEHLQPLAGTFQKKVFPWRVCRRQLYEQLERICEAAQVHPAGERYYTFHDLRRSFATLNAQNLDLFTLQQLMQHKSLDTTKKYVNFAHEVNRVVKDLRVPKLERGQKDQATG